mmetsp:Transcript_117172/g.269074  ORF Transcript_117172/g.269074 Transcript_117172/m.269074 type:complete len:216 (-) Transcript_117172:1432-2079(-)
MLPRFRSSHMNGKGTPGRVLAESKGSNGRCAYAMPPACASAAPDSSGDVNNEVLMPHRQAKYDMFSKMHAEGISTFSNMSIPFATSTKEISFAVVTITAPSTLRFCDTVRCTSPVPGGMSRTNTSNSPQLVFVSMLWMIPVAIGPRTGALSPGLRKPNDINLTPRCWSGSILLAPSDFCRPLTGTSEGKDGPYTCARSQKAPSQIRLRSADISIH